MRTDFENIQDGQEVILYPNKDNPLTYKRHRVVFCSGCFYQDGEYDGRPSYYMEDIMEFNRGFNLVE